MTDEQPLSDDDRALSLLLDDALPADQAAALRQRLALEPKLARRLEELAAVDDAVRGAYAGIADEPLPRGVTELLATNVDAERFRPRESQRRVFSVRSVLAPALALAAGFALAMLILPRSTSVGLPDLLKTGGKIAADSGLHDVLQAAASGDKRTLGDGWSATPRLSFVSTGGAPCRRVDLGGTGGAIETVACRADGNWRLEFVAFAGSKGSNPGGGFRPAGANASAAIDNAIDTLIEGAPLGRDAEQALIDRGWDAD